METISKEEIKKKLARHYGGDVEYSLKHRELVECGVEWKGGDEEPIGFALSGSPPKGYALVIPELRKINLYDHTGRRFRILKETVLEGRE